MDGLLWQMREPVGVKQGIDGVVRQAVYGQPTGSFFAVDALPALRDLPLAYGLHQKIEG